MATTFICYKNQQGFYIHESFMQLAYCYILIELHQPQYTFVNREDLLSDAQDIVNGYCCSYLVLSWRDDLINSKEEQLMIQLLQNIISSLQTKGDYISVAELQAMPTQDEHWLGIMRKKFPVPDLIRIFDALIQMLEGKWTSTNFSMNIEW